ncbi:hypothetical protein NC653_038477 [Populus alba x Populus x berolinensis]|uniref:Uncharacterized protein n=1 Tax=Populus alba x Populus x berolinensis TaxID=444605 RepID=A0AAD6LGY2_9ROSI|nr:hypothetical protein NC653_038477 [Populus alba x Populus x berolinensis]
MAHSSCLLSYVFGCNASVNLFAFFSAIKLFSNFFITLIQVHELATSMRFCSSICLGISSPIRPETSGRECEGYALPTNTFPEDRTCALTLSRIEAAICCHDFNVIEP